MTHFFDVDIAKEYGVAEAILLNNLWFWIAKNKANKRNYYDGRYWTYNSAKALSELFPYYSVKKIQRTLKKLEECGLILIGEYNSDKYVHTKWYAFTDMGNSIMTKCQFDWTETDIRLDKMGKSINTDNNTDKYTDVNADIRYIVDYLNEKANTHYKATSEVTKRHIEARLNEGFTVDDFKTVINKKVEQWQDDEKMAEYIRPQTLFGTKFEAYLNQQEKYSMYNY